MSEDDAAGGSGSGQRVYKRYPVEGYRLKYAVGRYVQLTPQQTRVALEVTAHYRYQHPKNEDGPDDDAPAQPAPPKKRVKFSDDTPAGPAGSGARTAAPAGSGARTAGQDGGGEGGSAPPPPGETCSNLWRTKKVRVSVATATAGVLCPLIEYTWMCTGAVPYGAPVRMEDLELARAELVVPRGDGRSAGKGKTAQLGVVMWQLLTRFYGTDRLVSERLRDARVLRAAMESMDEPGEVFRLPANPVRGLVLRLFGVAGRARAYFRLLPAVPVEALDAMTDAECAAHAARLASEPLRYMLSLDDPRPAHAWAHVGVGSLGGEQKWDRPLLATAPPFFLVPALVPPTFDPDDFGVRAEGPALSTPTLAPTVRAARALAPDPTADPAANPGHGPAMGPTRVVDAREIYPEVFEVWRRLVDGCRGAGRTGFCMADVQDVFAGIGGDRVTEIVYFLVGVRKLTCVGTDSFVFTEVFEAARRLAAHLRGGKFHVGLFVGTVLNSVDHQAAWMEENLGDVVGARDCAMLCPTPQMAGVMRTKGENAYTLQEYVDNWEAFESRAPITLYYFDAAHLMDAELIATLLDRLTAFIMPDGRRKALCFYGDTGCGGLSTGPRGVFNFFDALTHSRQMALTLSPMFSNESPPMTTLLAYDLVRQPLFRWDGRGVKFVTYRDDSRITSYPPRRDLVVLDAEGVSAIIGAITAYEAAERSPALVASNNTTAKALNAALGAARHAGVAALRVGDAVTTRVGDVALIAALAVEDTDGAKVPTRGVVVADTDMRAVYYRLEGAPAWVAYATNPIKRTMFVPAARARYARCNVVFYVTADRRVSQRDFLYCLGITSHSFITFVPSSALAGDFNAFRPDASVFDVSGCIRPRAAAPTRAARAAAAPDPGPGAPGAFHLTTRALPARAAAAPVPAAPAAPAPSPAPPPPRPPTATHMAISAEDLFIE